MRTVDSLEKTLMLGGIGGRRGNLHSVVESRLPSPSSEGLPTCLDVLPEAEFTPHTEPCFTQLKVGWAGTRWGGGVNRSGLSAVQSPALSALLSALLEVATVLFWPPLSTTWEKLTPRFSGWRSLFCSTRVADSNSLGA